MFVVRTEVDSASHNQSVFYGISTLVGYCYDVLFLNKILKPIWATFKSAHLNRIKYAYSTLNILSGRICWHIFEWF